MNCGSVSIPKENGYNGYMIINEIAGVAMAAGYINHLKKNGYFMQRKIKKWRSKKTL